MPVDAAWFRMEQGKNRADVVALMALEGAADVAWLRAVIEQRLLTHRRFRCRVVESAHGMLLPHWELERPFSLDAHLTHRRIAEPAGDAEILALVAEFVNTPMDFSRSPWRVCLIDGLSTGAILVSQVHHCMGDGFALLDVLLSMADGGPDRGAGGSVDPDSESQGRHRAAQTAHTAHRLAHLLADLGHLLLLPFDPLNRFRGVPGGERRLAWSQGVSLARVKAVAKVRGATVNDFLLAAVAGALRRYLSEHGDPTQNFRAIVPVNLRPRSEPVDEERGNWFGLVFVDLPIGVEDREQRVVDVRRGMARIKASEEPTVSLAVMNALGRSPAVIEHVADELFARKASIVVTNVPGPKKFLTLAGRRIRDIVFWAPHPSGLSCGVSLLSYAGTVRVGVRSDSAVVPDPELIARYFDDEVLAWPTPSEAATAR